MATALTSVEREYGTFVELLYERCAGRVTGEEGSQGVRIPNPFGESGERAHRKCERTHRDGQSPNCRHVNIVGCGQALLINSRSGSVNDLSERVIHGYSC